MNFSEQPPSQQWAALKYGGETIAQVWFKPEGEPLALTFRIPRESFQIPGVRERLTTENLLKAVAIATEEVESWGHGGAAHPDESGSDPELRQPLPPPSQGATYLSIHVSLKPPPPHPLPLSPGGRGVRGEGAVVPPESCGPEVPLEKWQDLEALWNSILGLEATIDTLRIKVEGLRAELETAWRRTLTTDEKVHALNADMHQWNKAKSRVHYALPKAREFIHRATWAKGAPDRKRLEEIYKDHIQPRIPFPQMDRLPQQLGHLLKDRQVLSAHGVAVCQECQRISADIQGAFRALRSNAAAKALKSRSTSGVRGKSS